MAGSNLQLRPRHIGTALGMPTRFVASDSDRSRMQAEADSSGMRCSRNPQFEFVWGIEL